MMRQNNYSRTIFKEYFICYKSKGKAARFTGKMAWKIRAKNWKAFPNEQKWFAVGECLSHIDYLIDKNKIYFEEDTRGVRYYHAI